jgi:hypothetical protein
MTPIVEEMHGLVANTYQPQGTTAPSTDVMGQSDFKALLDIAKTRTNQPTPVDAASSVMERNRLIGAMAEANMSDIDIARQFSMSRDEVQLILKAQQANKNYGR